MSRLVDEVLLSISEMNEAALDTEINVTKALMAESYRSIVIQRTLDENGIILEGDIIPKRDSDENIFIYIFKWIPRLIINICKKLKAKWKEWLNSRKERKRERDRKLEEEQNAILLGAYNILREQTVNAVGDPRFNFSSAGDFIYLCKTKSFDQVIYVYKGFQKKFELLETLLEENNMSQAIENMNDFKTWLETEDILNNEPKYVHTADSITHAVNDVAEKAKEVSTEITNTMNRTIQKAESIIKSGNIMNFISGKQIIANNFIEILTNIYEKFQRFDINVQTDISNAYAAIAKAEIWLREYRNRQNGSGGYRLRKE